MGGGCEDGGVAAEEDRTAAEEDTLPVQQCGLPGGAVARPAPGRAPRLSRRAPVARPAQTAVAVQQVGRQQSVVGGDIAKSYQSKVVVQQAGVLPNLKNRWRETKEKAFLHFASPISLFFWILARTHWIGQNLFLFWFVDICCGPLTRPQQCSPHWPGSPAPPH